MLLGRRRTVAGSHSHGMSNNAQPNPSVQGKERKEGLSVWFGWVWLGWVVLGWVR